jgi:hypothetical protein
MRRRLRRLWAALPLLAAAGCAATAIPYQPASWLAGSAGYAEEQKGEDVWHVSFSATDVTSRETVQTYFLYRCAELTLAKGYDGFEVLSRLRLADAAPAQNIRVAANGSGVVIIPMGPKPDSIMTHNLGADIRLLRRPFTPIAGKAFDATRLKAALAPYVLGQKCAGGNVCPHAHDYLDAPGS